MSPGYIQHNPLIADGPVALGQFFGQITGNAPGRASSSTGSSPSTTMCGST